MILLVRQFYLVLYLSSVRFNTYFTGRENIDRHRHCIHIYRLSRRYGFRIEREYIDSSALYALQVVLTVLLSCEPTLLYATETTALGKEKVNNHFLLILFKPVIFFSVAKLRNLSLCIANCCLVVFIDYSQNRTY
jgi:hypothetical protein